MRNDVDHNGLAEHTKRKIRNIHPTIATKWQKLTWPPPAEYNLPIQDDSRERLRQSECIQNPQSMPRKVSSAVRSKKRNKANSPTLHIGYWLPLIQTKHHCIDRSVFCVYEHCDFPSSPWKLMTSRWLSLSSSPLRCSMAANVPATAVCSQFP